MILEPPIHFPHKATWPAIEQWKNLGQHLGRGSASVMTFASWTMLVKHSRPSRSGSTTSGNRATSRAATFR